MSSTSETGHAVNSGNFGKLITICESFGSSYNPSNVSIAIPALKTVYTSTNNALKDLAEKETTLLKASNARALSLKDLKHICTRVVNAFSSCGADYKTVDNLKSLNRVIQGKRADTSVIKEIKAAKETAADTTGIMIRSVSRQSIEQLLDNFSKMIAILRTEKVYKPNEADLTVNALEAYLQDMQTKDAAVTAAEAEFVKALAKRDKIMYAPESGLVDMSKIVKRYTKSVFGASSIEFRKLNILHFRRKAK